MTTQKPGSGGLFDDMSRLMSNAMGVAQGAKDEAETAMKGWVDRWLADRNFVTREEFEAVREMAIKARTENAELRAMIDGNFDDSQVSGPAMKTWLAFWASSMHQPALRRLQRVNDHRLYSNLCGQFHRALPQEQARQAARGLASLIDGLWLRGALSGKAFDTEQARRIAYDYLDLQLAKAR